MTFLNSLPPQSWTASFNPFKASLGTQQTTCSIREHLPTREAKDSDQSIHTPPEGSKTPCVQLSKAPIYTQENTKDLPVGGRLKWFVKQWEQQGAHPFHLDILKQGYRLPFRDHPKLSRTPCIHSGYNKIDKDSALSKFILDLLAKNAIEEVNKQDSLGFYSRLFLVPKPGNRWRPVIDLSSLNQYLTVLKFKMETPESIRTSLKQGEWVTSIDLSDAYLHIPIHPQSRKFLRFHHKETSYQFTSLPIGLAMAPLVFTSLVKEVKLLALKQDIRLHQYLDDWLIRASSQDEAQKHTVKLLSLIQNLGFIVNLRKSELNPQQRFDFIGYRFLLDQGLVRPTNDRWNKIQISFNRISKKSVLSARTLMSTIGLLASTEKTVKLGRIHMRPFQWHLKTHWRFPMPLNSPIPWTRENETTREMVAKPPKCSKWRILTPERSRHSNLYRRIKRRLGRALKSRLRRRHMVSGRKTTTHKCIGTKSSDPSSTTFLTTMQQETGASSIRQHHGSRPHKQTGGNPFTRTLCPHVEASHMVQQKPDNPQGKTRPRLTQCN